MSKLTKLMKIAACTLAGIGLAACDGNAGGANPDTSADDILSTAPDVAAPVRTPLVVNGTDVPDLRYPFMAAVHFRNGGGFFSQGCGASLIDERWVVSAAHCYTGAGGVGQRNPDDVALVLGTPNLNDTTDRIVSFVSRIIVHPEYNAAANLNDIALLELTEPVTSLETITLSREANAVPNDNETATVAGWGTTSETGGPSRILQETDLPIVSTNACQSLYGNLIDGPAHLCAGGQRSDSCFGDSGGPLFVSRGDQLVQAGVVSFGFGCARPGLPAVYARTSTYFDWISDFVPDLQAFGDDDGGDNDDDNNPDTGDNALVQFIKSNAQGFAIETNGAGAADQNVFLWTANSSDINQQWVEIDRGDGLFSYQKNGTNLCMDGNSGGVNRQNVDLGTCSSSNLNQTWQKVSIGDGSSRLIKSNATGFALDGGSNGRRGQNVRMYDSSNPSQNLNWIITPI